MVKFLIEECGADFEHREEQLRTPIYYAASKGAKDILSYLVKLGADVNAKTAMGRNSLLKSTWNGEHEIVKILLEHKDVDVNC